MSPAAVRVGLHGGAPVESIAMRMVTSPWVPPGGTITAAPLAWLTVPPALPISGALSTAVESLPASPPPPPHAARTASKALEMTTRNDCFPTISPCSQTVSGSHDEVVG